MIEIDVEFRRGDFPLQVQFDSGAGLTGLFGPSGSGKTTLIHLIAGLLRPERGQIEINGETLFDSVRNIDLPARLRPHRARLPRRPALPASQRAAELALRPFLQDSCRAAHSLRFRSSRRCTSAHSSAAVPAPCPAANASMSRWRALLASPRILLMDEPLASLDLERKLEIMGLIERLRDVYRIPIIYVSHAIKEVGRLAGYVLVLRGWRRGRRRSALGGACAGNRAVPADRFGIASLIDCHIAAFDPKFKVTTLRHPAGPIVVSGQVGPEGNTVRVMIRATDVALAITRPSHISIRMVLSGTVPPFGPKAERCRSSDHARRRRPAYGLGDEPGRRRTRTRSRSPRLRIDQGRGDRREALPFTVTFSHPPSTLSRCAANGRSARIRAKESRHRDCRNKREVEQ